MILSMLNKGHPGIRVIERVFLFTITLTMLASCASSYANPRLTMPFDKDIIAENSLKKEKDFSCRSVPKPVKNMIYASKYKNKKGHDVIDSAAEKKYKKAVKKVSTYGKSLIKMSNLYLVSSRSQKKIASCVLKWMYKWERKNALLGKTNHTGEFVRTKTLATLASAYSQIIEDKDLDSAKTKTVERWLNDLAYTVVRDFSVNEKRDSRQNNHLYWAAWAVAATGIVLQDNILFDWAINKAYFALSQIADDGTLPLELARMSKALHYHIYAAGPLVMLAETAAWNGINLYEAENGALHRLVKRALSGLEDASYFKKRTGKEQNLAGSLTVSQLAWVEVYHKRFPSKKTKTLLEKLRPMRQRSLGGNLTLLYGTGIN